MTPAGGPGRGESVLRRPPCVGLARSAQVSTTSYGEHPDQVVDLYGTEGVTAR